MFRSIGTLHCTLHSFMHSRVLYLKPVFFFTIMAVPGSDTLTTNVCKCTKLSSANYCHIPAKQATFACSWLWRHLQQSVAIFVQWRYTQLCIGPLWGVWRMRMTLKHTYTNIPSSYVPSATALTPCILSYTEIISEVHSLMNNRKHIWSIKMGSFQLSPHVLV